MSQDQYDKQRRHAPEQMNSAGSASMGETAEILHALSDIDDLPIQPQDDPVMGQLISKLTSTANLSTEEVRSNEWVREYILILYLCKFPDHNGMHGSWRGWAHGDAKQAREPLDPEKRMELETLVSTSKLALSRSEDAKVIEESAHNVNENIVNDNREQESGGNGILGKLRS